MKPRRTFLLVLIAWAVASAAWLGAAEQQADKAVACSATVPAAAQTGAGVQFQAAGPAAGSLWTSDSIVGNLRFVPTTGAGGFTQGEPAAEPCQDGSGQFTHILTRNVAVMETEVTQGMWSALRAVQPTLPSVTFNFSGATLPAESLTWYEAVLFANLLSVQQGLTRCYYTDSGKTTPIDATNYTAGNYYCDFAANGYRLPADGEWEYFTRAGTTGAFSVTESNYAAGNCNSCTAGLMPALESVAWFCANSSSTTHAVGTKTANPWNLKDVHGNVWEWCWDWYASYPAGQATDYTGLSVGSLRVIRGGTWAYYPMYCRSASRLGSGPGLIYNDVGFRLLITVTADGPIITSVKAKTGKPGSLATIKGTNFGTDSKKVTVYVGTKKAKITGKMKSTQIKFTIPRVKKGTYDLYVVVNGKSSNKVSFQVK